MISTEINDIKAGNLVLTKDELGETWLLDLFLYYDDTTIYPYICSKSSWRYCIPFKGNEKYFNSTDNSKNLVGTDKDPKCECEEPAFLQKVIAWNPGFKQVKGYFLDLIAIDECKFRYKIINAENKNMEYFYNCVAKEWEE